MQSEGKNFGRIASFSVALWRDKMTMDIVFLTLDKCAICKILKQVSPEMQFTDFITIASFTNCKCLYCSFKSEYSEECSLSLFCWNGNLINNNEVVIVFLRWRTVMKVWMEITNWCQINCRNPSYFPLDSEMWRVKRLEMSTMSLSWSCSESLAVINI